MAFRLHIDKERCKGCALCVDACKQGLLKLARALNRRGQHYVEIGDAEACSGCRRCVTMCPDTAIEIEKLPDEAPPKAAGST
jgi:2-oxoglutarate ferredoxin oxidoreductase subunit delta